MRLVFYDHGCRRPYTSRTVLDEALGGTEATVARLAEHLGAEVLQHNRVAQDGLFGPMARAVDPTHAVTLREPRHAIANRLRYPQARHVLWLHDLCTPDTQRGADLLVHAPRLIELGIVVVGVSAFHAAQIADTMLKATPRLGTITYIYNPVVVDGGVGIDRDRDKIVFFSSPHKGLGHALRLMYYVRRRMPGMTLYVANPGYNPDADAHGDGIVHLGRLSQSEILSHVREALCTFYPNFGYPETFGLVMAESNAVGTPVLTHPIGAAPEVLENEAQFAPVPWTHIGIDRLVRRGLRAGPGSRAVLARLGLYRPYVDTLQRWRDHAAPLVSANPKFDLAHVGRQWRTLLAG